MHVQLPHGSSYILSANSLYLINQQLLLVDEFPEVHCFKNAHPDDDDVDDDDGVDADDADADDNWWCKKAIVRGLGWAH